MRGFDSRWALWHFGAWESLAIPPVSGTGDRWFKSNCADSIAEGQLLVVARVC
jgi:hypothetical protein